ncbi:MAG: SapC family protein [Sphingopyxis sp.]
MATVPNLPLFFNDLVPLSAGQHADWSITTQETAPFMAHTHAIPVTVDEFVMASRFYPIVFSSGDQSVPLALMGLNEGVNVFVAADGNLAKPVYIPAYVRRYPFLLAKLSPDSDDLSLCFDPTAPGIGAGGTDGSNALFDGDKPSKTTNDILEFCRQFEEAGARTQAFMEELNKLEILMDGEVAIQTEGNENPYIYRGFRMIDEDKLRDLRGDSLRKIAQSGMLPLLYAHLFSMQLMREIFGEQMQQGKVPLQEINPALNEVPLPTA